MSQFVCMGHGTKIAKARKPRKVTRTYKRVFNLSQTMAKQVQVNLVKGIKKFKTKISPDKLYNAWATGSYGKVYEVIPWDQLPEDLGAASKILGGATLASSKFSIDSLPKPIESKLRYDTANPRIRDFMDRRVGELVTNISEGTRANIQTAVGRSFDQALTPRQVADQIKGGIGLLPQHEAAVAKYRDTLVKVGELPGTKIESLANGYADRLLDYRAMLISRTETRAAANWGQLSVWQQAADQGLIDSHTAQKIWVVDGNPCEICEPMDEEPADLYGFWSLNNGDTVEIPSEAHPNCMCGMELDFGETEEKTEDNTPDDYEHGYEEDE